MKKVIYKICNDSMGILSAMAIIAKVKAPEAKDLYENM